LVIRPVDKKDNYIKRCVAIAGDTLVIKDGNVYVNGQLNAVPPMSQVQYDVETNGQQLDHDVLKDEYNVDIESDEFAQTGTNKFSMLLTVDAVEKMKKNGLAKYIQPQLLKPEEIQPQYWGQVTWPYDTLHKWTLDYFGPLWIPAKGGTLTLTP